MKRGNGCLSVVIISIGVLMVIMGLFAIGSDSDDDSTETTTAKQEQVSTTEDSDVVKDTKKKKETGSVKECSFDGCDLKYVESKIEKNAADETCLVLYFDFTNNSDDNKAFVYVYDPKAFQNGVEMEGSLMHVNEYTKNANQEIQPGTTLRVASGFIYTGDKSPIDVEVTPWASLTNDKLIHFQLKFQD